MTGDGVSIDVISGLLLRGALKSGVENSVAEAVRILAECKSIPVGKGMKLSDPKVREKVLLKNLINFKSKLLPVLQRLGVVERLNKSQ